ncbi:hypothetical protein BJ912DRAFT_496368 [Pholiota molesta]|nr:hypothetical protein BJ912DRAFT_496368 [Pholiota molesta]
MDFDGAAIQQQTIYRDTTHSPSPLGYDEDSTDYVKWQGSQTACSALNQLIKSSTNDPNVPKEVSTSRGWQREPSFDQIPGFSLLSTNDNHPSLPQYNSQASSSRATRPPHSRPRPSLARARSPTIPPDVTNFDLPIPFLDKSNPSSFMDMLKGVSARLDENVGVKPGRSVGGPNTTIRPTKRVRGTTSELQAGRPKRSRASAPGNPLGDSARPVDKGKRRAVSSTEAMGDGAADSHSSMSELPFPLRSSVGPSRHVIDDYASTSMDGAKSNPGSTSISRPPSDSVDPFSFKTLSQTKMPPPPAPPIKHPTPDPPPRHIPPKVAVITPSTNPPIQQQQPRSDLRQQSTAADFKSAKSDSGPRFHPLLLEQQTKASLSLSTSSCSASSRPQSYASKPQVPAISTTIPPAKPNLNYKPKISPTELSLPPSSTPKPPSSQSSRPPALGMRRTHTFPSSGMATSLKTTGALPVRQKAFKPPLLSASQPSSQASASQQQQQQPPRSKLAYDYDAAMHAGPGGSNGSASSDSLRGSATSSSGSSSRRASSTPSSSASNRDNSSSSKPAPTPVPESDVDDALPEPLDGDGDSSFGDMSFDLDADALEETMRMYD